MNYLNITKYLYLVIGIVMTCDAIYNWNNPEKPWLSVFFAALAFFTFFFRNRFAKRFEDRKNSNQPKQ
jgi:hypothetical protein